MSLKWRSVVAFLLMVAGLVWLLWRGEALARSIPAISIQICAVALMVSARVAFGRRSFHASANSNGGRCGDERPVSMGAAPDLRGGAVLRLERRDRRPVAAGAGGRGRRHSRRRRSHVC
jgi:hypothetical protein